MRRNHLSFFEDVSNSDPFDPEAAWPELRAALREPANTQDLGLWRLAEEATPVTSRPPTLVRLVPRTEPPQPDWPDAA